MSGAVVQSGYIHSEPWTNLFKVSPSQFNVTCQLQKDEFLQLKIINTCNDCIAWKLKTNRPGRYMVSPKQGIIFAKQQKDCTVVLAKLKQIPDTKKPDKFLIQATKIDPQTQPSDLPQLWKIRESKHNKKRGVYAYQSVTIKCFLQLAPNKSADTKKNMMIIEDYVSSESTVVNSPPKTIPIQTKSQPIQEVEETLQHPPNETVEETNETDDGEQNDENTDNTTVIPTAKPMNTDTAQYDKKVVELWKKKAEEYDDLFQFTRKTMTQRDELKVRWKAECEKSRTVQKLNRDMKEEKKRILSEYNKYRNTQNDSPRDEDEEYDDEEEKHETTMDKDWKMTPRQKDAEIKEMHERDQQVIKNSKSKCAVSVVYIAFTILLMYLAFIAGRRNTIGITEIQGHVENDAEKHEI
eukprot:196217_1